MIDSSVDAPPPCAAANSFGVETSIELGAAGTGFVVDRLDPGVALDVAVAVGTQVVILHGDGAGGFANPTIVDTAAGGITVEDFNQDARTDLILWPLGGDTVVARLQLGGAGAGTFGAEQPLPGPFQNVQNAIANTFDPNPDVVVEDDASGVRLYTSRLGVPGTFGRENTTGAVADVLVLVDSIDAQNGRDIVLVDNGTVKLAGSTGSVLGPAVTIATGATGRAVGFGKFDGDNRLDLVIATAAGGVVFVQEANGTFTQVPGVIPGVIGDTLSVIDINLDGTDDIVVPGSIVLQCPGPSGGFTQVESINATAPVALLDITSDGKPDLLRLEGTTLKVRLQ